MASKKPSPLSVAASALVGVLKDKALTAKLEGRIHRTMLWKWSTGRAVPDLERAVLLEELTEGRVRVKDWLLVAQAAPALAQGAA